jgi:hypothetical protein
VLTGISTLPVLLVFTHSYGVSREIIGITYFYTPLERHLSAPRDLGVALFPIVVTVVLALPVPDS